jgi:hypothetical protein
VWLSGVAAATLLTLGVNGTLSSWTSAIITNTTNTAAAANSVILQETGPAPTSAVCTSTDGAQTTVNSATCSSINKYGGTSTPLSPGGSQSVAVTMKNTGSEAGALTLVANTCTSTGALSGAPDLCGELQVKVSCTSPATTYPATGTAALATFASATATTPFSVATTLAANSSTICTFTVSLPTNAPPTYAGQTISQPLVWTLAGA